jgi:hypothetical protein
MKKNIRGMISVFVCLILLFSSSITVFATNNDYKSNTESFKDVQKGHWAYNDIMWMLDKKIIEGIGNDKFGPDDTVTRAQFAKMMVNTLNIKGYSPNTPSFIDVNRNAWEYTYVEAAKTYLTGFRTTSGDYFKPSQAAVREDMAVALVKALGYQNETADESLLNGFADAAQISPNLRKYVALSVKHGLIEGYTQNGQNLFGPQGNLTRAQSATLLYRAFKDNEEKITYDEDKVTYDNDTYIKPAVSVTTDNNKLVVKWSKIDSTKLTGYVVVISAKDSTPTYPDNGYLFYITDKSQTSAVIDNSTQYSGSSDFGKLLEKDKKYYISVTAVYNDKMISGNTVCKTYPGSNISDTYTAPVVYTSVENGNLVVRWNKIASENFKGYRVVISKNDATPQYPDNGYLLNITDKDRTYAVINNSDKYNEGDFGNYLTKGEKYYFSVTAVYSDRTVAGNSVQFQYDGINNPDSYITPVISVAEENGKLVLRWNKIDSQNLVSYRVVASKSDTSPSYPDNGYLYSITDSNRNYAVIDNTTGYTEGDFNGYFIKGEKYYFNVTAVYKDRNVTGNTIQFQYNGDNNPALFPAPVVSTAYEAGNLSVKWNKIESPQLVEYRLVISQNNKTPAYPAQGYYDIHYDVNTTSAAIDMTKPYTNGDFTALTYGNEYYFSVTAVYKDNKYVAGNAVKVLYLVPAKQ